MTFCIKSLGLGHSITLPGCEAYFVTPHRERKKAKAAELQAAVQALSERIQELTVAQRRNAELRARNAELQQVSHIPHFSCVMRQSQPPVCPVVSPTYGYQGQEDLATCTKASVHLAHKLGCAQCTMMWFSLHPASEVVHGHQGQP